MEFPRYVFKGHETKLIHHESQKPEGWFWDVTSALNAPNPEEPAPGATEPEVDMNAPPTREELEAKARELGISFHHKTGDKKLSEMIEKALGG